MDSRLLTTIIIFPIWLALVLVFRRHRQWLFYYLVAAFGLTLQLVFLAEHFGLDQILVNIASFHVKLLSTSLFKLQMELLSNGRFQLVHPSGGIDILKLGIECSAILESSILISLLLFYPLFSLRQRLLRITFGLVVTYVINIFRLLIIVLMANKFGSDYIFLAHAGVARVFFFIFELLLYWYLLTKPTVKSVGDAILNHVPLKQTARSGHSLLWRHTVLQAGVVMAILSISLLSFEVSNEWKKSFVEFARKERPIIYEDETSMESSSREVLGEQTEVNRLDKIEIKDLGPGQEWKYRRSILKAEPINLQISEGIGPMSIEVELNNVLQNRAIVSAESPLFDYRVFQKDIEVGFDDILEIRVKNIGQNFSSYLIDILKDSYE